MEKKRESNSGNMCFREGVLPNDLWRYIGLKLDSAADRIRFRAVSKTWMSLVPFCQPPWLMLAEQEEAAPISPPLRGFVCLGEQNTHLFDLPDLHQARCVGSTGNWLATIHLDKSIRLLNPFTRHQFHLPPVSAFDYKLDSCESPPDLYRDSFVWKIVLSSSPPDCVAVAVHHHYRVLAFARPQCASWTTIPLAGSRNLGMIGIQDMIFYNHKLYAITFDARLMACDIPLAADDDAPKLSFLTDRFLRPYYKQKCYLVECRGELLLVIKFVESSLHLEDPKVQDPIYATKSFQVYKFDSSADIKFTELKSLGTTLSISPTTTPMDTAELIQQVVMTWESSTWRMPLLRLTTKAYPLLYTPRPSGLFLPNQLFYQGQSSSTPCQIDWGGICFLC